MEFNLGLGKEITLKDLNAVNGYLALILHFNSWLKDCKDKIEPASQPNLQGVYDKWVQLHKEFIDE